MCNLHAFGPRMFMYTDRPKDRCWAQRVARSACRQPTLLPVWQLPPCVCRLPRVWRIMTSPMRMRVKLRRRPPTNHGLRTATAISILSVLIVLCVCLLLHICLNLHSNFIFLCERLKACQNRQIMHASTLKKNREISFIGAYHMLSQVSVAYTSYNS